MEDDLDRKVREWREGWIAKIRLHSWHPIIFWQTVADRLIGDRRKVGSDPRLCLSAAGSVPPLASEMLVTRNQEAINLEHAGYLNRALILYEAGVADCFSNLSPYEHLRSRYMKRMWYEDALRVCASYLALPERPGMGNPEYFRMYAAKLTKMLRRQRGEAGGNG